jgi:hypothetical protein
MEDSQIGREEVLSLLRRAGEACPRRIEVYLIGGGAMALRGEKDATKDIDLVLESQDDADELKKVLERIGFRVDARRPDECRALVDATILSRPAGLRADIFVGKVCGMMAFSEGMKSRAVLVGELGKVTLFMCSREDIFLLKSVTERMRDLDDMMSLFRSGLSRDTILGECDLQSALAGFRESHIWEAFLFVKIQEMEKRYGISVPWKRALRSKAELKMGAHHLLNMIDKGILSIHKLSEEAGETPEFTSNCLRYLEKEGEIRIDRKTRPYRIMKMK